MIYPGTISFVNTESLNESSWFPKEVVQEYLNSERFKTRLNDGMILGTLTHKYRHGAESVEGLGADDRMLDEAVITHVLRSSWIEGDEWKAEIEVFDNLDQYADEELPVIKRLLRLLDNGVNLYCSVVIDGDWADEETRLTRIQDLIGLDFTLNPALEGSKVFVEGSRSEGKSKDTKGVMTFSARFNTSGGPTPSESNRREFAANATSEGRKMYSTPNIIKQQLLEMKRNPGIRMSRLVKSCRTVAKGIKNEDELQLLNKLIVKEFSFLLSEYSQQLIHSPSLKLQVYYRLNSSIPEVKQEAEQLSKVMIRASKIQKSQGSLPKRNQIDLNESMNQFLKAVSDAIIGTQSVLLNPLTNM